MSLVADYPEGHAPVMAGMRLVPTLRPTHGTGTHAAPADATS